MYLCMYVRAYVRTCACSTHLYM